MESKQIDYKDFMKNLGKSARKQLEKNYREVYDDSWEKIFKRDLERMNVTGIFCGGFGCKKIQFKGKNG